MSDPTPHDTAPADEAAPVVTLSREQLRAGAEWVVAGHVRLRRRIVTETRTIEVTVRREELTVETDAAMSADGVLTGTRLDGEPSDAPALDQAPMVFVLREEVPEVVSRIRAYEQVTVHVGIARTEQDVSGTVRSEAADLLVEPLA